MFGIYKKCSFKISARFAINIVLPNIRFFNQNRPLKHFCSVLEIKSFCLYPIVLRVMIFLKDFGFTRYFEKKTVDEINPCLEKIIHQQRKILFVQYMPPIRNLIIGFFYHTVRKVDQKNLIWYAFN